MNVTVWDQERIFFSGDEYYDSLVEEIQKAQKLIEVECYIFEYDEIGTRLIDCLVEAARRGVIVKVIVDGIGSAYSISTLRQILLEAGAEFKVFHPILSPWFMPIFRTINRRNHRKTWIFDQKIAYTGSFNVSKVHTSLVKEPWRDTGIRVVGEDVQLLSQAFNKAWKENKTWKKKIFSYSDLVGSSLVRLNDSKSKRRAHYRDFLGKIREAEKYIFFGNAYFAPHIRLVRELCYSARRGVEVHLLVPQKSDIFFMPWVSSTYYFILLKSGVKIHEYMPTVFHAKNYVIDDWMLLGSSNLNYRSLFNDLEIDLRITHPENKKKFLDAINEDMKNSEPITFEAYRKLSWIRQKAGQLLLLFRGWL